MTDDPARIVLGVWMPLGPFDEPARRGPALVTGTDAGPFYIPFSAVERSMKGRRRAFFYATRLADGSWELGEEAPAPDWADTEGGQA